MFVVVDRRDQPRPVRSAATVERLQRHLSERAANQQTAGPEKQPGAPSITSPRDAAVVEGTTVPGSAAEDATARDPAAAVSPRPMEPFCSPRIGSPSGHGNSDKRMRQQTADWSGTAGEEVTVVQPSPVPADGFGASFSGRPLVSACGGVEPGRGSPGRDSICREDDGGSGTGGGGGGGRVIVDARPSVVRTEGLRRPPGTPATEVRRRYGGDIRRFMRGYGNGEHSKCD